MMPDWAAVVQEHGPAAWRAAFRLLGHRADADDCLQEALLQAVELGRREEIRQIRAVLVRLASSRALDRLRQRYRHRIEPEERPETLIAGPAPAWGPAIEHELAERLRAALAELPEDQAEAFVLCCLEGWTYADAAARLGSTVDRVGVHIHRARSRLRERLAGFNEAGTPLQRERHS